MVVKTCSIRLAAFALLTFYLTYILIGTNKSISREDELLDASSGWQAPQKVPLRSSNHNANATDTIRHQDDDVDWSSEMMVLQSKTAYLVTYNVTAVKDSRNRTRTRWLKRQYIPRNGTIYSVDHIIQRSKRGLWAPPSRRWPRRTENTNCPVRITFCYDSQNSLNYLDDDVKLAMGRWHDALGPSRGVNLEFIGGDRICALSNTAVGYSSETVQITLAHNRGNSAATMGYYPIARDDRGKLIGPRPPAPWPWKRHHMLLQPQGQKTQPGLRSTTGTAAHELGHVLGLEHEHQRPDAAQHVEFVCENMQRYALTKIKVEITEHIEKSPGVYATMEDACTDLGIAAELSPDWAAGLFMPVPESYHEAWRGGLLQSLSAFDFESIMLYPGRQGEIDTDGQRKSILNRADDHSPIGVNEFPSKGDVAAVKDMYPDIH